MAHSNSRHPILLCCTGSNRSSFTMQPFWQHYDYPVFSWVNLTWSHIDGITMNSEDRMWPCSVIIFSALWTTCLYQKELKLLCWMPLILEQNFTVLQRLVYLLMIDHQTVLWLIKKKKQKLSKLKELHQWLFGTLNLKILSIVETIKIVSTMHVVVNKIHLSDMSL